MWAETDKVKRLRDSGAVKLHDDASREYVTRVLRAKYRAEYRIFTFIERLGRSGRVLLLISAV